MAIVLLAVGLLVTAAGFVTIGFGIPINAFSLGNTLIVAGTIGVAAGLILIGLAAAIGQLRKIADALAARTGPARTMRPAESAEPAAQQSAPRVSQAAPTLAPPTRGGRVMREPEPVQPEPVQPEPRFPATATSEPAGPLDWLRARPKPPGSGLPPPPMPAEPPVVEVPDEAPLSPRPPQRSTEATPEPRVWSPSRPAMAEPRPAARAEPPMPRPAPQPPEPHKPDFDLVWPDRAAPAAEPRREEQPAPARPREPRMVERRPEPAKPAAERGPAILKSGVIDGMPYTLYADGSIEAELPQGTVKFASVDALRAHLEKQS